MCGGLEADFSERQGRRRVVGCQLANGRAYISEVLFHLHQSSEEDYVNRSSGVDLGDIAGADTYFDD